MASNSGHGFQFNHPRHKTLTLEEERKIIARLVQGDLVARDRLVNANMKFVFAVARDFQNRGLEMDDLIIEGSLGLIRAAMRFNPANKGRFISYAVWWVRQGITKAIHDQGQTIKTPLLANVKDRPKLKALSDNARKPENLDVLQENGHDIRDEETHSESRVEDWDRKRLACRYLNSITGVEREVLSRYFGLNQGAAETLDEIGVRLNLTRERIRQIKETALRRLRKRATRIGD